MKKTAKPGPRQPAPTAPRGASIAASIWFPALILFLVAGGTWAFFEFVVWNAVPAELVGKWVVTDGPQEGATFDFYRSGKMVGRVNQGGQLAHVYAAIRVEGDKIYSTTLHPKTGQETTIVQTIRTLTAKELVVEDAKGKRLNMERAD